MTSEQFHQRLAQCRAAGDNQAEHELMIEHGRALSAEILARPPGFRLSESYAPPRDWPHGTPYRIADEHIEPRDIEQAHALVTREKSTLEDRESDRAKVRIEEVCFRIQTRVFDNDETTLVWYHPDTSDFWAYPGAPIGTKDEERPS